MPITDLQRQIITSVASRKIIVSAGPGTGKTFCLIERIKHLINDEQLEPATELLVLTFSVAASREIKNRLQEAVEKDAAADELLHVTIRTFDSFASAFMYRLDSELNLDGESYDQRIVKATELIRTEDAARIRLQRYRHIMVDEVQDLVGLRASLTLEVLNAGGDGFTLLGDPAQAVYNFLMGEEVAGPTSDEFLREVNRCNENKIQHITLTENFRAEENPELKTLAETGRRYLLEEQPKDAYAFLRRTFADLPPMGSLNDVILPDDLCTARTAFLCRKNGQVLRLARQLSSRSVPFFIRQPLDTKDIPAWVGCIFLGWQSNTIKKKKFQKELEQLAGPAVPEPDHAWRELQAAARIKNSIRATQLRSNLLEDGIFAGGSNTAEPAEGVILSTVHRAKGREFDNVILTIPEESNPEQFLDEGRVMFVGLTRARHALYKLTEHGSKGIWKNKEEGRWIRTGNENGRAFLTGVELGMSGDTDIHSPVSLSMFDEDDEEIEENQEFLWESVQHGAPVRLELYRAEKGAPVYYIKIIDDEEAIAVALTSGRFGQSLKRIIGDIRGQARPTRFPGVIDDLWVRDVVTEVGNLGNEDVPRIYRTTGLWLGVRLQGLGTCREWRELK